MRLNEYRTAFFASVYSSSLYESEDDPAFRDGSVRDFSDMERHSHLVSEVMTEDDMVRFADREVLYFGFNGRVVFAVESGGRGRKDD